MSFKDILLFFALASICSAEQNLLCNCDRVRHVEHSVKLFRIGAVV